MLTADANPVVFQRVCFEAATTWRRVSSFAFINRLQQIPLSDSELLQSSHHLPIAIDCSDGVLQVVAITADQFQRTPLLNADGQWQRGYMPISLRCFPFRYSGETLEIANDSAVDADTTLPLLSPDGSATTEIKSIVALLRRLEVGKRRLHAAAERLFLADVLTPLQMTKVPGATELSSLLTVDRNKFDALSARRIAQIAREDFLPFDVATACLFSQRLTPAAISVTSEPMGMSASTRPAEQSGALFASGTELDDSELFSFEAFNKVDQLS